MIHPHRKIQASCVVLLIGLLAMSGWLSAKINTESDRSEVLVVENQAALARSPELGIVNAMPGGLRVLAVNWLWIRSQDYHNKGRHYDALQLAEIICQLQPYQPGVWHFQAWNMAWNISVTKQTREERWKWVYNGVKLLRDRGIPLNPKSLPLYQELAWIFNSKIAGRLDEAHQGYKSVWAGKMQHLLGAPPYSTASTASLADATQEVIDAFRVVAEAPVDYASVRQGREFVQPDQREILLKRPELASYAARLAAMNVAVDESLLTAYNLWSLDEAVSVTRLFPPTPQTEAEKALSSLINDAEAKLARDSILAFLRAQLLWNQYRMDPRYMHKLMERYKAPLDWRHALSHSLYWSAYGLDMCGVERVERVTMLTNRRHVLNSLKVLTATGVVTLLQRPEDPEYPQYNEGPDIRYIAPTDRQHREFGKALTAADHAAGGKKKFKDHLLSAGHVNFMIEAMGMLVADGRALDGDGRASKGTAQYYFESIRKEYDEKGGAWGVATVQEFITIDMQGEDNIRIAVLMEFLPLTLKRAFLLRGIRGDQRGYTKQMAFGKLLYTKYQTDAVRRLKLKESFLDFESAILIRLLLQPRGMGVNLTTSQRSDLYLCMSDRADIQQRAYLYLLRTRAMQALCRDSGLDFNKAFPKPEGFDAFLEASKQKQRVERPDRVIPD